MPLLFLDDFALDDIKKQKDSKYSIFFLNKNELTMFENYSKCRIWILAFSTNFCAIKTDLSGTGYH